MSTFAESIVVRPLRYGERSVVERVFAGLSERSRRLRFLGAKPVLRPHEVELLADVGCCGREAIVASERHSGDPVGIARYVRESDEPSGEIAFAVVDAWQRRGIGRMLAQELARVAVQNGIQRFRATVAAENAAALSLLTHLGPVERRVWDGAALELTIRLR